MRTRLIEWVRSWWPHAPSWVVPDQTLLVGVAFLACTLFGLRAARRDGWRAKDVAPALGLGFLGALVGARVLGMVFALDKIIQSPGLLLRPDKGGSVSFGALLGGLLCVWAYCRWRKLDPWALADSFAPVGALALGFARLGCFMQGCDYGRITGWPWGVRFPAGTPAFKGHLRNGFVGEFQLLSLPVHPVQLLMAGFDFVLFVVFWVRPGLGRGVWPGRRALVMAAFYFGGRFVIEFLRSPYTAPMFGFLNLGQWLCVVGGLWVWWAWRRRALAPQGPSPDPKSMIAKGDAHE